MARGGTSCGSRGAAAPSPRFGSVRFGRRGAERSREGTGRELRVRLRGAAPPRPDPASAGQNGRDGSEERQHGAGAVPRSALAALPGGLHLRPVQQHPLRVQTGGADEG